MSDQNEIALSRYPRVGKGHLCLIYIISFQVKGQGQMVVLKKHVTCFLSMWNLKDRLAFQDVRAS